MLVKTLLTFGADVNPLNNFCQTPLDIAISKQCRNIVTILVSVCGKTGDTVLKEGDQSSSLRTLEPFDTVCKLQIYTPIVFICTFHSLVMLIGPVASRQMAVYPMQLMMRMKVMMLMTVAMQRWCSLEELGEALLLKT